MGSNAPEVLHQTIKLSRGKHGSPRSGACVMELASMLAGEPFTDQPVTACPVIGGFMRAYNDACDDRRRQDLLPYAAAVIGTRGDDELAERRAAACLRFAQQMRTPRTRVGRWFAARRPSTGTIGRPAIEAAGVIAARALRKVDDATHPRALAFIDELIAIGGKDRLSAGALAAESAVGGAAAARSADTTITA
jgi:hypothetical protein